MNQILNCDCIDGLSLLQSASVDCCITSPPYYGLRDYGHAGQIGLEKTPDEYVNRLVEVFAEVKRVLKPTGTLWLNLGDSYSTTGKWGGSSGGKNTTGTPRQKKNDGLKNKDLIGIPWMTAFALRFDGWYLRQDIIWNKTNPMPESVRDRCTKCHEYIFMLSKQGKYFYDADLIKTPVKADSIAREGRARVNDRVKNGYPGQSPQTIVQPRKANKQRGHGRRHDGFNDRWDSMTKSEQQAGGANKRSVWTVSTKPFKDAHFATFPPDLIEDCALAGCPPGGLILDPFMGAGTTALVAKKQGKNYIGFELNPDYCRIAENRLK